MSLSTGLALEDITVAAYAAQASYSSDPQDSYLSNLGVDTADGLQSVDLSAFLPAGSDDVFDSGNVFQGGSIFVSDLFATDGELRDAFATAILGRPTTGTTVETFRPFADAKPAEAVAFVSDGSGAGDTDTLYLAIRGTDNIVDAAMGGQAFTADGQSAYFMMLLPFFEAALAYARDEGLGRVVVTGGSLGGSMADLFSLFLKPQWEAELSVSVVSIASAGLADGVIAELGAALGLGAAALPTPQADGTFARPDDHLNFANTEDIVPNPDLLSGYLITDQLQGNARIADAVRFDQVTLDGTVVDFQTNTFGAEHAGELYLSTMTAFLEGRDDLTDAETLADGGATVGGGAGDAIATGAFGAVMGLGGNDTLSGSARDETLMGGEGNDLLIGAGGDDWYFGGAGNDQARIGAASRDVTIEVSGDTLTLISAEGTDSFRSIESFAFTDTILTLAQVEALAGGTPVATEGNDTLPDAPGAQAFDGLGGIDTVDYSASAGRVLLDFQSDVGGRDFARFYDVGAAEGDTYANVENAIGSASADNLRGDAGVNVLEGGGVSDRLYGRAGDDVLMGGSGADALYGNLGTDTMTGGDDVGRRDRYIYFQTQESGTGAGNRDVITDFVAGEDRIELSRFDADTTQGFKQAFDWIGNAGFSAAGQLGYRYEEGNTIVQADFDGDGAADFEIELTGTMDLTADDFLI
ncbi:M10 family metallopeptidase C-terminal domain-containing protein [Salipiger mucosus]|uniref:Peptidase M10 serralysin C-terminal domain-containing protein n=1 Tax=Salipiger mucosus DSM 16094 TaxID=1123237 RepID=S9QZB1_9RHOB|nr:M10 family metallopeptidase C-terminal domain-containing protein [Salipiger mucosus]EPX85008.1 hypothetical protein Salmuc_00605 [Salipiger mucosus DSM 16094]